MMYVNSMRRWRMFEMWLGTIKFASYMFCYVYNERVYFIFPSSYTSKSILSYNLILTHALMAFVLYVYNKDMSATRA